MVERGLHERGRDAATFRRGRHLGVHHVQRVADATVVDVRQPAVDAGLEATLCEVMDDG